MTVAIQRSGPGLFRRVWTLAAMRALAQEVHASMVHRTFVEGEDVRDRRFRGYSEKPVYISGETAKRLAPKGGKRTESGAVYYEGGYAQYKQLSRQHTGEDAVVDLTLSGQLRRSLRVVRVLRHLADIGLTGQPGVYGQALNRRRKFVGLSPRDRTRMQAAVRRLILREIERSRARSSR